MRSGCGDPSPALRRHGRSARSIRGRAFKNYDGLGSHRRGVEAATSQTQHRFNVAQNFSRWHKKGAFLVPNLVCDIRLESWVEPVLLDMVMLHMVGFIRRDTLEEIASLLLRNGTRVGPLRVAEE